MPDIGRLIISDLNMVKSMRFRCFDIMDPRHRLDSRTFFFETVCAIHPKMNLSIHGHRFFKHREPIDIPANEDGARIACDGERDWWTIDSRQSCAIDDILQSIVCGKTHNRFSGNLEALARPQ